MKDFFVAKNPVFKFFKHMQIGFYQNLNTYKTSVPMRFANPASGVAFGHRSHVLSKDTVEFGHKAYGKHKVPRYLYHFTSKEKLKQIEEAGFIRSSLPKNDCTKGVFMVDMNNFLKYWKEGSAWKNNCFGGECQNTSLAYMLLQYAVDSPWDELVCIRIPTSKLDKDSLEIRSQNKLFEFYNDIDNEDECFWPDSIIKRNLYNQRKEALEWIYDAKIPFEDVEVLGSSNILPDDLFYYANKGTACIKDQQCAALHILHNIFSGHPEDTGVQVRLNKLKIKNA